MTPDLATVPAWALVDTRRDGDNEIGIGSGETLEQATRYALQDVASRISVSIESELRDSYTEINGASAESLEQVIQTRVLGTRFTGWERTRTAEAAGVFWVEVRIDRRRLVRESRLELNELSTRIDEVLDGAQGSALRRLMALQSTSIERDRIDSLVALLDVLDPNFDRTHFDARRADWIRMDASARRSLVFEVRSDRASQEIARWMESRLALQRFNTRKGGCLSEDAVCIDIRSDFVETDIASRYVAKIRSVFAVLEPGGRVLRESDMTARGDSRADPGRARRKALNDLRERLAITSVLDGLIAP